MTRYENSRPCHRSTSACSSPRTPSRARWAQTASPGRPVDVATDAGAVAHDGDLLHHVFMYHLLLSGIGVVSTLE